jgi:hypothetical protein
VSQRQQILYLWLAESALDAHVVAWAFHDGSQGHGPAIPASDPPFKTGAEALNAGWMLLQTPNIAPPVEGREFDTSYLGYEFVFERRIEMAGAADESATQS